MAKIYQTSGKGGQVAIPHTSFYGLKTPPAVQQLCANAVLSAVAPHLPALLDAVFLYRRHDHDGCNRSLGVVVRRVEAARQGGAPDALGVVRLAFAGLYKLVDAVLRFQLPPAQQPPGAKLLAGFTLKREHVVADLKTLNFSDDFVVEFLRQVTNFVAGGVQRSLSSAVSDDMRFADLLWKIDVGVSSGVVSRLFESVIVMELRLQSGRTVLFEVPVVKFHELRFKVAQLLKNLLMLSSD